MRMKKQSLKFKNSKIKYGVLLLYIASSVLLSACEDKKYSREKYLYVQDIEEQVEINYLFYPVISGRESVYVFSNIDDYTKTIELNNEDGEEWVKIVEMKDNLEVGATEIVLEFKELERGTADTYYRRHAVLSLVSKDDYLADFVTICQGFYTSIGDEFEWLKYGSSNPMIETNEKLISGWNEDQFSKGWTSTVLDGNSEAYCYGKNGYVKIGSSNFGADLITPSDGELHKRRGLMLCFDAVAYTSVAGIVDNRELTLNIIGGGSFDDGTTSRAITLPTYDYLDPNVATSMWESANQKLFFKAPLDNPFTVNTQIQFKVEAQNRAFIKNVYLYELTSESYYLFGGFPEEEDENL